MLLGMAPVVTVIAETSLGLVPILGLPTAAVYLACRGAIQADRRRARAEAEAEQAQASAAEQARLVEGEQALIRQLQESDRLKRDLLATVSHELKTPLTVILGTLGTLSRRGAALEPAERREFVDMAIRQGTRLKELIEQLLLAARFEQTGREPAEHPLVDAAALARDALTAARVAHPGRELVLVSREVLPVRAAPEAVLQVLGNLLDNAAKYSPDRGPVRLEATRYGPLACWPSRTAAPGSRRPTASASSSASPSSTRAPPGGPAGSASASTSPASWPSPRTGSWSSAIPPSAATAPASSSACP
jgi:signal transduction histidine kinase